MKHHLSMHNKKIAFVSVPFFSSLFSLALIFLIILIFALVITKIDATDIMLSVMSTAALCVGSYAGGYISGKRRRKNGLLMGVLCGVFIFLIIAVLGAFLAKTVESFSVPVKFIVTLVCAGIGVIVGVNSKDSRY